MKDLFGKALLDFHFGRYSEDLITETSASLPEILPLSYLFRTYSEMPILEQKALELCQGDILDVGCGSGIHTKYLSEKGLDVSGIDNSDGAVKVCLDQDLNVQHKDLLDIQGSFDTIIMLMNGTGIFQEFDKVEDYLIKLKSLLKPTGQLLIDSSDVVYLFEDTEHEPQRSDRPYYGELDYYLTYQGEKEKMKWLYLDEDTFSEICKKCGLDFEVVMRGDHFDYLARITIPSDTP